MSRNLARGIIFAAVIAVFALFVVQQQGSESNTTAVPVAPEAQPVTPAIPSTTQAAQLAPVERQEPQQEKAWVTERPLGTEGPAPQTERLEPPVFREGMTAEEFKTSYREWKKQKAANEGKLEQFYASEERHRQKAEQHELRRQERSEARTRWLASMNEWKEQKSEAERLGLPVPPRPMLSDFLKKDTFQ